MKFINFCTGIIEKIKDKKLHVMLRLFLMTWALVKVSSLSAMNGFGLIYLALCFLLYKRTEDIRVSYSPKQGYSTNIHKWTAALAIAFDTFIVLVDHYRWSGELENVMFKAIVVLCVTGGLFFLFDDIIWLVFEGLHSLESIVNKADDSENNTKMSKLWFARTSVISFVCYLPYFLYLYPAVMTPDSINQLEQAMGMVEYSNHHPWIHTLIIKLCFNIGVAITGSHNFGVALYTLFQMLVGALGFGYVVATLYRLRLNKKFLFVCIAFYALVPYNAVFAVTVWKDVLFGYVVMIFVTMLVNTVIDKFEISYVNLILFMLLSILICLLRSNGFYGFILTAVVLIIFLIKKRKDKVKAFGIVFILAILGSILIKGPVMKLCGVAQPDFVESLSVPLQQVANVVIKNDDINKADMDLITNVIDTTYIRELYEPTFADNIKELVRAGHPERLEEHKIDYLRLYLRLGVKYPRDYLDAYIGQTSGYWYPDSVLRVADAEGVIDNKCGVYMYPVIRGHLVVKTKEILLKLGSMLPIYGSIWSVGTVLWLVLIMFVYLIVNKNACYIIFTPLLSLVFTVLIATPVSGNFRYVYFMVLTLPLVLGVCWYKKA